MKVKLSEFKTDPNGKYDGHEFIVDQDITISYKRIENCIFNFESDGRLNFDNCAIVRCKFNGLDFHGGYLNERGAIIISNNQLIKQNYLSGHFHMIHFSQCRVIELTDHSATVNYLIQNTEVVDSVVLGRCRILNINSSTITSKNNKVSQIYAIWNKSISGECTCSKVTFLRTKVNPYYLVNKCYDKTTLDLSSAFLIDDWSRLRKKYGGLSLFIVFLLTFFFVLPILTHSFFLVTISKIEEPVISLSKIRLWEALLYGGKTGLYKCAYATLTIILILYNIARVWMTISISKLQQEEKFLKDANFHLISIHPNKLRIHIKIDRFLNIIFCISAAYSLLKLIDTLFIMVPAFN